MQQNVQSQKLLEAINYSQQRNSIPSKVPESLKLSHQIQTSFSPEKIFQKIEINQSKLQYNNEDQSRLRLIEEQIRKQKQLIQQLKIQNDRQKQWSDDATNKSYLSLSPNILNGIQSEQILTQHNDLLQTKTQADFSFLQNRKNFATKQLESEEQKYRENIRKMQMKKTELRKKLRDDQEIPIKIMNFKELQKNQNLQNQQQNQLHESVANTSPINRETQNEENLNFQNQPSPKNQQKQDQQASQQDQQVKEKAQIIIEAESQRASSKIQSYEQIKPERVQMNKPESLRQSSKLKSIKQKEEKKSSIRQFIQEKQSRASDNKSEDKSQAQNRNQNQSGMSGTTSAKKYSVKKSSAVLPEFNQSMKQIIQRRERKSRKAEPNNKNSGPKIQNQKVEQQNNLSEKSKNQASSIKKQNLQSDHQENQFDQKSQLNSQKQKSQMQANQKLEFPKLNSQKSSHLQEKLGTSLKQATMTKQNLESDLQEVQKKSRSKKDTESNFNNKKQLAYSQKIKNKDEPPKDVCLPKQKSIKASSKKEQKIELIYIPHTHKQPSHKSFKKTDKSAQWSQVDMSFYKTNDALNSQNNSQIISQANVENNIVQKLNQQPKISHQIQSNKITMKKNKSYQNNYFQDGVQKQIKSDKTDNLAPIISHQEKSEKQSIHSKSIQKTGFLAESREGSVKQKVEKYDNFHKQHSLNNKKLEVKKLEIIESKNSIMPASKPASYRSRKSNPVSVAKSKTHSANNKNSLANKQTDQEIKNDASSDLQRSKVLISKSQIDQLYTHIKNLEEKLIKIQQKQELLAQQKSNEILKLQQIVIQEEKLTEELKKSHVIERSQQNEKQQFINQFLITPLLPEIQSLSKQLKSSEVQQNQQNITQQNSNQISQNPQQKQKNFDKSMIEEKQNVQQQINHLAEVQAKFKQEKEGLLNEISQLKKAIRDLQIQKIKSIDHDKTIVAGKDQNSLKILQSQTHQFGVIVHQSKKNQTIQSIKTPENQDQPSASVGKIVKNNSPQKNQSQLVQQKECNKQSVDKKFRINFSKKSSILSDNIKKQDFIEDSGKKSLINDESGNELLERKKKQSYPINAKQGYFIVSQGQLQYPDLNTPIHSRIGQQIQVKKQSNTAENKPRKSEFTKEQILERFHRTNREFNNFIQSSRIINETQSSMSSQNNFFVDKGSQSSSFSVKKASNQWIEDNPENVKQQKKVEVSLPELKKGESSVQFQQNFTRLINDLQEMDDDEEEDKIQQIQIRDIQIPNFNKIPNITLNQDELMELAKQTFKIFNIELNFDDQDFNMKKYKNCVVFNKGIETILWHYTGKFYIGGWKGKEDGSGEKNGFGIELVPDKHIYKGQFMNGKKHGTGFIKTSNGNIYDGQWIDGIKNGQGIYYDATTKVVYQGEWKDGKKNGFGVLKFSQKQYYKGTFIKSVKDGYGVEFFINGDRYKGEYRKGKFHGKGKYTWANTSVFEGNFCEGMRHGNGCWKSSKTNGDVYVGTYQNDKKSGYGRYVWSNGCIYEGNFAEDVKHGRGRLIYTDGKQIKGVWQEGSLLEAVTQNSKQNQQQQILKRGSKIRVN